MKFNNYADLLAQIEAVDTLMKKKLCEQLGIDIDGKKVGATDKFIEIIKNYHDPKTCIKVFTTNYDRIFDCIPAVHTPEKYLVNGKLSYRKLINIQGDKWKDYLEKNKDSVLLFKLHGSFNLSFDNSNLTNYRHSNNCIVHSKCKDRLKNMFLFYPGLPETIIGGNGIENFFNSQFDFFKDSLRSCEICIIIGFSFGSERIMDIFKSVLQEKRKKPVKIILWADKNTDMIARRLIRGTGQDILLELIDEPFDDEHVQIIDHYLMRMIPAKPDKKKQGVTI